MKTSTRKTSQIVTTPMPIGGWNVRDPLPQMKPTDAVILDNIFCLPSELQIRKGYVNWATGITGNVETIFDYDKPSGAEQLFGAANNAGACSIYDVTAQGVVGAAVVTGLTNAQIKHSHFTNSGGTFMHCVNGADYLRIYNGTTWYTVTGVSAPYAITGIATTSFIDVITHKRRMWFVEKASLSCWYLATDAIAGAATKFDFGPIFRSGGKIVKIDTWTLDAGYGIDDMFAIFTSAGEVAVYRGTDPASAADWALVGVFSIGAPITQTGTPIAKTCKYGGDLLILNKDGIAQMSKSLMSSRVSTHLQMTDKIQPQLANDTSTYVSNQGWDVLIYPPANMLIVNIPISATEFVQYVMNTISGAWSRWTGLNGQCWYFSSESLYFGTSGKTCKAWESHSDNGAIISSTILPAFQNMGGEGRLKQWKMARIIYTHDAQVSIGQQMLVDFDRNAQVITSPSAPITGLFTWGISLWGDGSVWGGVYSVKRDWKSISGMGYWGALQVKVDTMDGDVRLFSIDYAVEAGGVL